MAAEVLQGTMGSGKSAVAVARAIKHLWKGGVVACNFSLVDGWAETVVKNHIIYKLLLLIGRLFAYGYADSYLVKKSTSLYSRFYRVDSLPAIKKIFPVAEAVGLYLDNGKYSEGSGLLILDECALVFNSRNSMTGNKNLDWIQFFTQSRKLGWNCILIAHSIEMIDSQIRPLCEYSSTFRNLQKVVFPMVGIPVVPFPLFLVIKKYAGLGAGAGTVHSRGWFPLPLWAAQLYNSLEVFSVESWGQNTEPTHCGPVPVGVTVKDTEYLRRGVLVGPHWDDYLMTRAGAFAECSGLLSPSN